MYLLRVTFNDGSSNLSIINKNLKLLRNFYSFENLQKNNFLSKIAQVVYDILILK